MLSNDSHVVFQCTLCRPRGLEQHKFIINKEQYRGKLDVPRWVTAAKLAVRENPTDGSHPGWGAHYSMESNLTNWHKVGSSLRHIDHVVVEHIVVGVDQQRLFTRWANKDDRRG